MQNVRNAKSTIHRFRILNVLHIFIRDTVRTYVEGRAECVFKTDEVGQGGVSFWSDVFDE